MIPLRADARDESTGLDETQHGEEAYGALGGVTTMADH
jgi:ammonia channel protein AmtB